MRPLIDSILRLRLLCAAMHRCLFCRSRCVTDGLSRGGHDPATAAREIGVSPGATAALGWAARGDGGFLHPLQSLASPLLAVCIYLQDLGGIPEFALLKEREGLQDAAKGGVELAQGLGEAAAQLRTPKSSMCPQSTAPSRSREQEQAAVPSTALSTAGEPGACTRPCLPQLCGASFPGWPKAPGPRGGVRAAPAGARSWLQPPCPFPPLLQPLLQVWHRGLGVIPTSQLTERRCWC